jgi:hypothetical protein
MPIPAILIGLRALEQRRSIPRAQIARDLRVRAKRDVVAEVSHGHRPELKAFGLNRE